MAVNRFTNSARSSEFMMEHDKQTAVDVIVPVFNEEEILPEFHRRLMNLELPLHVIYVDNASTDRSVEIISSFENVTLIKHARNEGYGGSLLDGIEHSENEKIVIIDADCEYPPEAIPELIEQLDYHDVVYASRFLDKRNHFMPVTKRVGNQIISFLFHILFNQKVTDLYTWSKAFNRSALSNTRLTRKGFEHVLELGVAFARKKIKIHEIAVAFTPRRTGKAKMQHVSETLKYLALIFYYFFVGR